MCAEFEIVEPKFNDLDTLDSLSKKDLTKTQTMSTYSGPKCKDGPFIEQNVNKHELILLQTYNQYFYNEVAKYYLSLFNCLYYLNTTCLNVIRKINLHVLINPGTSRCRIDQLTNIDLHARVKTFIAIPQHYFIQIIGISFLMGRIQDTSPPMHSRELWQKSWIAETQPMIPSKTSQGLHTTMKYSTMTSPTM